MDNEYYTSRGWAQGATTQCPCCHGCAYINSDGKAVTAGSAYTKQPCVACGGDGLVDRGWKACAKCTGFGFFADGKGRWAAYPYSKQACPDCGGKGGSK